MAIRDFLSDLFGASDRVTQADVLGEFRAAYPVYSRMSDEELAPKIAKAYPKHYGFLESYDPKSVVPRESIRAKAQDEVDRFKSEYPRYKDADPVELATRMEEVYPDKYTGLAKRLQIKPTPDIKKEKDPSKIESGDEKTVAKPAAEELFNIFTGVMGVASPASMAILKLPGIKEQAARKVGQFVGSGVDNLADVIAAVPAASQYVFGDQGPTKELTKVAKFMREKAMEIKPDDPTWADEFTGAASTMAIMAGTSMVGGAAAMGLKALPLVGRIPMMAKAIPTLARSLQIVSPAVTESAINMGNMFNQRLDAGDKADDAALASSRVFWANLPVNTAFQVFGGPKAANIWKAFWTNGLKETVQEESQMLIEKLARHEFPNWGKELVRMARDPATRKALGDDALKTASISFLLGGGAGAAIHTSQITPENIDPGLLKKTLQIPGLPETAIGKQYPIEHPRIVDALEDAVAEAENSIAEGKSPEQVGVDAVTTFVDNVDILSEIPAEDIDLADLEQRRDELETQPASNEDATRELIGLNAEIKSIRDRRLADLAEEINAEMAQKTIEENKEIESYVDKQVGTTQEPAVFKRRRLTRKAKREIRRMAQELRDKENAVIESGKDPFIEWAKQTKFRANEDVKEEARDVPLIFKSNQAPRLDEFAQMAVNEGLLPEGTTGDQALQRIKNWKTKKRVTMSDMLDQAEEQYFSMREGQRRATKNASYVLSGVGLDDKTSIQSVEEIAVEKQSFNEGRGEYSADRWDIKGVYIPGIIQDTIKFSKTSNDLTGLHETWHAIRRWLATKSEARVLDRAFRDRAKAELARIKKENPESRATLEQVAQEIEADTAAEYVKGKLTGSRIIDRVFAKVQRAMKNLGAYFSQRGFTETLDDQAKAIIDKYMRIGLSKAEQRSANLVREVKKAAAQYQATDRLTKLVPAVRFMGKVYKGTAEDMHADIYTRMMDDGAITINETDNATDGFYLASSDQFMDRHEALAYVKYGKAKRAKVYGEEGLDSEEIRQAEPFGPQYSAERGTFDERYKARLAQAKAQGLNDKQAQEWAKEKMADEEKTRYENESQPKLVQAQFGSDGMRGFGQGRQGEMELPMYSAERKAAPAFYFPVENVVNQKMQNRMGSAALLNMIRNTPGIKQEELEWSGIQEWLSGKETVTKAEVQEFLAGNRLEVQEVIRGGTVREEAQKAFQSYREELIAKYKSPEIWSFMNDGERQKWQSLLDDVNAATEESPPTKYSQYTLPGGENYREVLFTLPLEKNLADAINKEFRSSHFPEPNILAHVRFNERTDTEGKRTLFIEEIQSDWHQQGREKGYAQGFKPLEIYAIKDAGDAWYVGFTDNTRITVGKAAAKTEADVREYAGRMLAEKNKTLENNEKYGKVPDAPLKKTWHEFVLKRMLRYAADNGFDQIAWTTGEQQADRYSLAKQADAIAYNKLTNNLSVVKDGRVILSRPTAESELPGVVGKEIAGKVAMSDKQIVTLTGLDLKVGGEGMKGFYDKIIPEFLNRYAKKWGAKAGSTAIQTGKITNKLEEVHSLPITPEMRDSVIYAGQPMYSAEDKKGNLVLPDNYRRAAEYSESAKDQTKEFIEDKRRSIGEFMDKIAGVISTRLGNIHPSLKRALRKYEFAYRQASAKDIKIARPMLEKMAEIEKTNPKHWRALDLAMKNGDTSVVDAIFDHYGIDPKPVRDMLNRVHARMKTVGYEVGYRPGYFPRRIKDAKGFIRYWQKQGEVWGTIEEAILEKEKDLGRTLTTDEKANLINSFIRGFVRSPILLAKTGNMKTREIEKVTPEINHFYYNSRDALLRYLVEVNEAIEARKFFGRIESKPDLDPRTVEVLDQMSEADKKQSALSFNNIDDSIGAYVNRLLENRIITPDQQQELTDILRARFKYTATRGSLGLYKNIVYMDTIANPISAITQLEDLGISLYRSAWDTPGSLVRAAANRSNIKLDDLALDALSEEVLEISRSSSALRKLLRASGFTWMDRVGKETYLNTAIQDLRTGAKNGDPKVEDKIVEVFGTKSDQVINDLASGKVTEDILFMAFNELSETQPITLAEVPQTYLESPGGRLFYALKTFMIKRLDMIRNEVGRWKTTPEKLKNFLKLYAIMIAFGGGVDELKDFILNRTTKFSDRLIDNLLKPFGISKFMLYRIRDAGPAALLEWLAPPSRFIKSALTDIGSAGEPVKVGPYTEPRDLEITQSIPLGGKNWYWWFGRGAQKERAKQYRENDPKAQLRRMRKEARESYR